MKCGMDVTMLDAYVDESLSPEDVAAVEEHMRGCPECANEALGRLQRKRATRAAAASLAVAPEFQMRPEFRLKIESEVRDRKAGEQQAGRWKASWVPWVAGALVAILLAAVTTTLLTRRGERTEALAEALDLHVATMASPNPVDVVSTDRHTVKPWFQGKLPFTFNLPELQDSPYKLLGGKLVYLHQAPGAELLFELRKHEISVFIAQEQAGVLPHVAGASSGSERGFSEETWSQEGLRWVVISDTSPSDVHALGELLRGAGK